MWFQDLKDDIYMNGGNLRQLSSNDSYSSDSFREMICDNKNFIFKESKRGRGRSLVAPRVRRRWSSLSLLAFPAGTPLGSPIELGQKFELDVTEAPACR